MFKLAFIHSTHLLARGPSSMVFKHLRDLFDLEDSTNDFSRLFLVCYYIITRRIPGNITRAFNATKMLTLAKPFNGN